MGSFHARESILPETMLSIVDFYPWIFGLNLEEQLHMANFAGLRNPKSSWQVVPAAPAEGTGRFGHRSEPNPELIQCLGMSLSGAGQPQSVGRSQPA